MNRDSGSGPTMPSSSRDLAQRRCRRSASPARHHAADEHVVHAGEEILRARCGGARRCGRLEFVHNTAIVRCSRFCSRICARVARADDVVVLVDEVDPLLARHDRSLERADLAEVLPAPHVRERLAHVEPCVNRRVDHRLEAVRSRSPQHLLGGIARPDHDALQPHLAHEHARQVDLVLRARRARRSG